MVRLKAWNRGLLWACVAVLLPTAGPDDGLSRLVTAYPEFLAPSRKANVVVWRDGTEMVFDDGVMKRDFEDLLNRASLKDQMSMRYPAGWPVAPPKLNEDPGRARHEPFFEKMYGGTAEAVSAQLEDVEWMGSRVRVTRVNGVADALRRVAAEIGHLPADVRRYVAEPIGTFHWRPIAGTKRRSMHSYGAAIDFRLPGRTHRYWRWEPDGNSAYPEEILGAERLGAIVRVFEKHGFIWGGKWRHFDTMHFEYRPELLPSVETQVPGS